MMGGLDTSKSVRVILSNANLLKYQLKNVEMAKAMDNFFDWQNP